MRAVAFGAARPRAAGAAVGAALQGVGARGVNDQECGEAARIQHAAEPPRQRPDVPPEDGISTTRLEESVTHAGFGRVIPPLERRASSGPAPHPDPVKQGPATSARYASPRRLQGAPTAALAVRLQI